MTSQKQNRLAQRTPRMVVILMMAGVIFFGYRMIMAYYYERRVVKNMRLMQAAMEKYKQAHGYPSYGEMWRNTQAVNAKLGLAIEDNIFNYKCYGWTGWTSFVCDAESPVYQWHFHFHEGVAVHCFANDCPSCSPAHDPQGGC